MLKSSRIIQILKSSVLLMIIESTSLKKSLKGTHRTFFSRITKF